MLSSRDAARRRAAHRLVLAAGLAIAVAASSVTACTVPPPVTHPRIWLTPAVLSSLRSRAQANAADWQALKATCDDAASRPVAYPDGTGGGANAITEGYQGWDYVSPVFSLALCYQTMVGFNAAGAAPYATAAVDILLHMSDPAHHVANVLRDDGYGIRTYGVTMSVGYDWLSAVLTPAQRTQIYNEINRWVSGFDSGGFNRDYPNGNYFAGYYAAKGLAALATEGDNPRAATMWDDWLNRIQNQMVQPYYSTHLVGGGSPEGWNYGPLASINLGRTVLAVKTAKGLDLTTDPAHPFHFPAEQAGYVMNFAWPNQRSVDDRGALYESDNPSALSGDFVTSYSGILRGLGTSNASQFQKYAHEVRNVAGASSEGWENFLWWDGSAAETSYAGALSYPTSYEVSARSAWSQAATWVSFRSGPYVGYGGSGEEFYDQGGPAIVRGGTPLLVNTAGWLMRNTPGTDDSSTACQALRGLSCGDELYDENYGDTPAHGNRSIYNVFYVTRSDDRWGQLAYEPEDGPAPSMTHTEDAGSFVRSRGDNLDRMYRRGNTPVSSWTRDFVYLRPGWVIAYDRTTVNSAAADQWLAWHLPGAPAEVASGVSGAHRFNVTTNGTFAGAVTTVFPNANNTTLTNVYNSGKLRRLEVRPATGATGNQWLTVFDTASSAGAVATTTRLSSSDGNVSAGAVKGVSVSNGGSRDAVVLFGTGAPSSTTAVPITYTVPMHNAEHVVVDLSPGVTYKVAVTPSGSNRSISITSAGTGTPVTATAQGTLCYSIDAAGAVGSCPTS